MGKGNSLLHGWWKCKLVQPLWITMWRFLKKLEIELPYDPAIPLLGIHSEETRIKRDMCPSLFIAALFTITRIWKQPRCPSADEWIRKLWYIYTQWNITQLLKRTLSLFTFMHWRRKWQPTPVFLPGESQGRGSLVGCRLWGHTESDTTEVT